MITEYIANSARRNHRVLVLWLIFPFFVNKVSSF